MKCFSCKGTGKGAMFPTCKRCKGSGEDPTADGRKPQMTQAEYDGLTMLGVDPVSCAKMIGMDLPWESNSTHGVRGTVMPSKMGMASRELERQISERSSGVAACPKCHGTGANPDFPLANCECWPSGVKEADRG